MPSLVYDLPPGTLIDGRYKLLKALGQGGFGITYIAWDSELQRNVAVKECFPVGICLREQEGGAVRPIRSEWEAMYLHALDDMRKEARTLATLNHENIVRIHDVIWGNGSVFCVMPWLASGSLKQRITSGSLGAEESIHWLRQLLDALDYLHSRGIFHRDLKPDNIMFDEVGNPVIIDFGAALNRPELTTTTTQGSFSRGYAAPEQITGKGHVGPWTDLYALSATWYELLTGILPEASDARLMEDDLKPLTSDICRMSYPGELLALLQRNLSLRPAERCQSVAQCLECWQNGTLPQLPIPRHGRLKRRAMIAAALVALASGAAYTAWVLAPAERVVAEPSAEDIAQVRERMERKLREVCKVQKYGSISADYQERIPAKARDLEQKIRALMDRTSLQMHQVQTRKEAERLADSFLRDYNRICAEQEREISALNRKFHQISRDYLLSEDDITKVYRPKNMTEAALLSSVSGSVAQELQRSYDAVVIALSQLHTPSGTLSRQVESLHRDIVERAAEL